jgi:hypothetical protein
VGWERFWGPFLQDLSARFVESFQWEKFGWSFFVRRFFYWTASSAILGPSLWRSLIDLYFPILAVRCVWKNEQQARSPFQYRPPIRFLTGTKVEMPRCFSSRIICLEHMLQRARILLTLTHTGFQDSNSGHGQMSTKTGMVHRYGSKRHSGKLKT